MRIDHISGRSRGFTLIEVMLALSITLIAVTSAAAIVGDAYRHIAVTDQLQRAHYRAASHLASLGAKPLEAGRHQGVYRSELSNPQQDERPLTWTLLLIPIEASDLALSVQSMTSHVQAMRAELQVELPDSSRQVRLSTILFSAPSDPSERDPSESDLPSAILAPTRQ